jgi:hypothetical protein
MPRKKSDETETETSAVTKPPRVTVRSRSEIIERRLADPMGGGGSLPIPSRRKDRQGRPLTMFYIANAEIAADHVWRMRKVLGWEFATPEDIDGAAEDHGFELRDGRLVRGLKGSEVLMKMPKADYDAVQQAKSDWNRRQALGNKETKATIVERASAELGDEGADFLNRSISNVKIEDTYERIPVDEQ